MSCWQPILPSSVEVNSVDAPGGTTLGSLAIGGGIEFTYIPNFPVWTPVDDSQCVETP